MKKHPVRAHLDARARHLKREGLHPVPDVEAGYSSELFVLERLLEFPFESYPDYCYPGHLLMWPPELVRWQHVEQVMRFIEGPGDKPGLRQPTGARKNHPVRLLGFQVLILFCILGPEDEQDHLRVSRTVVMSIARKNAKTALVAMLFLAMLTLGAFNLRLEEIRVGASDRKQAGKLFQMIRNMILLDRTYGLGRRYHVTPSYKTIAHKRTLSTLEVISSEAHRAHGGNDFAVLLDELGNIPDSVARDFLSVLSTGFGTQAEPLFLIFSTQAALDSHIFSEFVDQAKATNTARDVSGRLTGFIFDLPKEEDGTGLVTLDDGRTVDIFAERNWRRPNPALEGIPGGFKSIKDMRDQAKQAKDMPSTANAFANLQLNQRVTAHSPFISQTAWNRCQIEEPMDEDLLRAAVLFIGGDVSVTTDLSALAFVWRLDSGKFYARLRAYTPAEGLMERARVAKVPYDTWVSQGRLTATPGASIDASVIASDLVAAAEEHSLQKVGFDRYKWRDIQREARILGFDPYEAEPGDFWVPIGQGYIGQSPCVEALEKLIIDENIMIERNPVGTWMASNAVTTQDAAGNRKFEKSKSYGKIDGVVALSMAVWLATQEALMERAGEGTSVYERGEDLLVL